MSNIFKALLHCSIITFFFLHQLRPEMDFHYCDEADILAIFVTKTSFLGYSEDINGCLIITYNMEDQIASISLYSAAKLLHLNHLTFNPVYHKDSDQFSIKKTEIEGIEMGIDDSEKIVCLLFHRASDKVAKELSEEEKDFMKKGRELTN